MHRICSLQESVELIEDGMERLLSCFICEHCTALRVVVVVFCDKLLWLIAVERMQIKKYGVKKQKLIGIGHLKRVDKNVEICMVV